MQPVVIGQTECYRRSAPLSSVAPVTDLKSVSSFCLPVCLVLTFGLYFYLVAGFNSRPPMEPVTRYREFVGVEGRSMGLRLRNSLENRDNKPKSERQPANDDDAPSGLTIVQCRQQSNCLTIVQCQQPNCLTIVQCRQQSNCPLLLGGTMVSRGRGFDLWRVVAEIHAALGVSSASW